MKLRSFALALSIFLWSLTLKAQKVCFEDFQVKIGKPLQKAFDQAKGDKEMDSLLHLSDVALKDLEGCPMPNFQAKTLSGKLLSRKSLKGKIVVMNFWFIGCKPCVAELPALNKLVQHYKKKDVVFIAFGNSSRELTVKKFLPMYKFDYQIVTSSKEYADKFNTPAWPMNMVFDQEGILKHVSHGGYIDERAKTAIYDTLTPLIDMLLSKR